MLESLQPARTELLIVIFVNDSLFIVESASSVVGQDIVDFSKNFELLSGVLLLAVWNPIWMNLESLFVVSLLDCKEICSISLQIETF